MAGLTDQRMETVHTNAWLRSDSFNATPVLFQACHGKKSALPPCRVLHAPIGNCCVLNLGQTFGTDKGCWLEPAGVGFACTRGRHL
jgi:hypothetical protein